jgi:hypothetical protein
MYDSRLEIELTQLAALKWILLENESGAAQSRSDGEAKIGTQILRRQPRRRLPLIPHEDQDILKDPEEGCEHGRGPAEASCKDEVNSMDRPEVPPEQEETAGVNGENMAESIAASVAEAVCELLHQDLKQYHLAACACRRCKLRSRRRRALLPCTAASTSKPASTCTMLATKSESKSYAPFAVDGGALQAESFYPGSSVSEMQLRHMLGCEEHCFETPSQPTLQFVQSASLHYYNSIAQQGEWDGIHQSQTRAESQTRPKGVNGHNNCIVFNSNGCTTSLLCDGGATSSSRVSADFVSLVCSRASSLTAARPDHQET